jgi:hypothetical protein
MLWRTFLLDAPAGDSYCQRTQAIRIHLVIDHGKTHTFSTFVRADGADAGHGFGLIRVP